MSRRIISVILFIIMTAAGAFGETTGTSETDSPSSAEVTSETPQWALDLRRAEIVATGSFPLTLLAARLTYSLLRFAVHGIQSSLAGEGIDMAYAPWFLAPPGSPELEFPEKLGIVAGAATLSSLIALIDYRRGVAEGDQEP